MTHFRKVLPAALAALLLLPGCELADMVEVAVSGPECGSFGLPPDLEERGLDLFGDSREPVPLDETIAELEPYEDSHGPDVLFALGLSYARKASTLSDDPADFRRGQTLLTWAALCGQPLAVISLGVFYDNELPGADKNPELGVCLDRAFEAYQSVHALLAGRVWACGLRMEDLL